MAKKRNEKISNKELHNSAQKNTEKASKNTTQRNSMVYIFKVTLAKSWISQSFLKKVKEPPYRIIAVQGKTTLYRLGLTILDAFNFYHDHLFGFFDNTKNWVNSKMRYELNVDLEGEENTLRPEELLADLPPEKYKYLKELLEKRPIKKGVKKTKVSQVFEKPRQKMLFLFDYGDEWQFIVELKKITDPDPNKKYPTILEVFGEAPEQYPNYEEDD